MDKSLKVLNDIGIRITPQRLAVYKVLSEGKHLSADFVYKKVKESYPAVSFATVYTILQLFKDRGLVLESRIDFERSTFELMSAPHHHFMCKSCGEIVDINIPLCDTLKNMSLDGIEIEDFQGYFYGICKKCRAKRDA
jgi:Fur family transcriptional regulator, peroxide stress response regulator